MDPHPTRARHRSFALLVLTLVLAVVALGGVAAGLLYAYRAEVAEALLRPRLAALLRAPVRLEVAALHADHAVIRDLGTADGALKAARVVLRYDLRDLVRGRLQAVEVAGLVVRANRRSPLPALDPRNGSGADQGRVASSLPPVTVREARLVVSANDRPVELPFSLHMRTQPTGELTAEVTVKGPHLSLAGLLTWTDGSLTFEADDPAELRLPVVPPALTALLPPPADQPVPVRVSGFGNGRWRVTARRHDDVWRVETRARLALGRNAPISAEVEGSVAVATSGAIRSLDLECLDVDARSLRLPFAQADLALRLRELRGGPRQAAADATLHALLTDLDTPSLAAREAAFSGPGRLELDGERVAWRPTAPGRLWLDGLRLPGVLTARSPVAVPVQAGAEGGAALEVRLDGDGSVRVTPHLRLGPFDLAAGVPSEAGTTLEASIPLAVIQGRATLPDGGFAPAVTIEEARLALPAAGLDARGVGLRTEGGEAPITITADAVRRTTDAGATLPLAVKARLERNAAGATLAGEARGAEGAVAIRFQGALGATGRVDFASEPIVFAPDGVQPWHLLPALEGLLDAVRGAASVDGHIAWDDRGMSPRVTATLDGGSARRGDLVLEGLSGAVTLDGLAPPTSPPGQRLSVELVQAVLPMTDGEVVFRLDHDAVRIGEARLHLAGGRVGVTEAVLPLGGSPDPFVLGVEGVDLSRLALLFDIEGLTVTGSVSGRLPVAIDDGTVVLNGGRLAARGPGTIRYRPRRPPEALATAAYSQLLLTALSDFHYQDLTMRIDGHSGGEITAALRIRGHNPDLYEGYPLEFNLTISGDLEGVLAGSFAGSRIRDTILDQEANPDTQ